jgi:hypothetical protein
MGKARQRRLAKVGRNGGKTLALSKIVSKISLEEIPCTLKLFIREFNSDLIRRACLEYWVIHDFNWADYSYPSPKGQAANITFCHQDHPGDMATALSLEAFAELVEAEPVDETKIRTFCMVVCGLGKAMQLIDRYQTLTPDLLYQTALKLTGCQ